MNNITIKSVFVHSLGGIKTGHDQRWDFLQKKETIDLYNNVTLYIYILYAEFDRL